MFDIARQLVAAGGWVMLPLFALSITIWLVLGWRGLRLLWQRCDAVEAVWAWVERPADLPEPGRGLQADLCRAWRRDPRPAALEAAAAGLRQGLAGSHPVSRALIQAAPLLGLLGTVTGMIQVFDSLALVGLSAPGLLADGISQALITTETGLLIAVPALFADGQLDRLEAQLLHHLEQTRLVLRQTADTEVAACA